MNGNTEHMKEVTLSIHFDSPDEARVIAESLNPELLKNIPHTHINMVINEKTLRLSIAARQTSTLRAACNSYIRWIQTALSVHNVI